MDEKVIHIDPLSLKIPDNKTRKKRNTKESKIKIKSKYEKKPKVSTLKRNLLNMIRSNQENMLKKERKKKNEKISTDLQVEPKNDFEESVQFFENLKQSESKIESPPNIIPPDFSFGPSTSLKHNRTFKSLSSNDTPKILNHFPKEENNQTLFSNNEILHVKPPPPYGVLKNGSKPTYRNWVNSTQKQVPSLSGAKISRPIEVPNGITQENYEVNLNNKIKEYSEREKLNALKNKNSNVFKKIKKQKRTIRRKHRVGKSKVHPSVSVLVSNKTIRNNTNLKKTELRETPIKDVKQYLRKQGFIKVGTSTPNDVLRQMFENVRMICGDVQNHNPDNLLYNYFNDTDDSLF